MKRLYFGLYPVDWLKVIVTLAIAWPVTAFYMAAFG